MACVLLRRVRGLREGIAVQFTELRQLMADVFECDPAAITPDSTPDSVEAWDSLRLLDLILAIEQQTGIEISPDRIEDMMSVPAILAILREAGTA
jgi:acyl carrier protein